MMKNTSLPATNRQRRQRASATRIVCGAIVTVYSLASVDGFATGYTNQGIQRHAPLKMSSITSDVMGVAAKRELMDKFRKARAAQPRQRPSNNRRQEAMKTMIQRRIDSEIEDSKPSKNVLFSQVRARGVPAARSRASRHGATPSSNKDKKDSYQDSFLGYNHDQLLSAQEEYSLAIKVQFVKKCEDVYAGLSNQLMRLPTISEWAYACGFQTPAYNAVDEDIDRQIRPMNIDSTGSKTKKQSKVRPVLRLGNFYDDSAQRFQKNNDKQKKKQKMHPVNRGNPHDFSQMMLDGKEAKQRLIQHNMRLVASIANKYYKEGMSVQDLIQEGSLGLATAVEKFDPSKGFRFSTYASWWIQQAVFQALGRDSRTIRLPMYVHNFLIKMRKTRAMLYQELGRAPTPKEVADELEMPVAKYNKLMRLTKQPVSLESSRYQSNSKQDFASSEVTLEETLAMEKDEDELSVNLGLFRRDLKNIFNQALNEDEQELLNARYGLDDSGLPRSVPYLEKEMQKSQSKIRRQEAGVMRKLRSEKFEQKLREHHEALVC